MKSFEAPLVVHSINCQKSAKRIIKSQVDRLTWIFLNFLVYSDSDVVF